MAAEGEVRLEGRWSAGDLEQGLKDVDNRLRDLEALADRLEIEPDVRIETARERIAELAQELDELGEGDDRRDIEIRAEVESAVRNINRLEREVKGSLDAVERKARENPFDAIGTNAAKEAARTAREFERLERNFRNALADLENAADRADLTPDDLDRLERKLRSASDAVVRFADRVPKELRQAGTGFERVERSADQARTALERFSGASSPRPFQQLGKAINSLGVAFKGFIAAVAVDKILDFGRAVLTVSADVRSFRRSLEGLLGAEAGAKQFERLASLADVLGVRFAAVRENAREFTFALERQGFTLQEATDIYTAALAATQALGGDQQKLNQILKAFSDIASTGTAQMEELKEQLANAGIPLKLVADALGVTTEELREMAKNGELLSDEVLPKIAEEMLRAFGTTAANQVDEADAALNRLRNSFERIGTSIGEKALPPLAKLFDKLADLSEQEAFGRDFLARFTPIGRAITLMGDQLRDTGEEAETLGEKGEAALEKIDEAAERLRKRNEDLARSFETISSKLGDTLRELAEGEKSGASLEKALGEAREQLSRLDRTARDLERAGIITPEQIKAARDLRDTFDELSLKPLLDDVGKLRDGLASLQAPDLSGAASGIGEGATSGFQDLEQAADQAKAALERLNAERDKLRENPAPSQEETSRLGQLPAEIANAEAAYASLSQQLEGALGRQRQLAEEAARALEPQKDVLEFLGQRIERLGTQYARLSPELRSAFDAAIASIAKLAESGKVTDSTMTLLGARLQQIFLESGQVSAQFAANVARDFANAAGGSQSFADIVQGALDKVKAKADEAAGGVEGLAERTEQAGGRIETAIDPETGRRVFTNIGEGAREAAGGVEVLEGAGDDGATAISNLGSEADTAATGLRTLAGAGEDGRTLLTNIGPAGDEAARGLGKVATPAQEAGSGLEVIAAHAPTAGTGFETIATHAPVAAEALANFLASTTEGAEPLASVAASTETLSTSVAALAEPLPVVATGVEDLGTAAGQLAEDGSLGTIATELERSSEAVGSAQEAIAAFVEGLENTEGASEVFERAAERILDAAKKVGDDELRRGIEDLAEAVEELGKAKNDTADAAERTGTALDNVRGFAESVKTGLSDLAERLIDEIGPNFDTFGQDHVRALIRELERLGEVVAEVFRALNVEIQNATAAIRQFTAEARNAVGVVEELLERLNAVAEAREGAGV